MVCKPGMWKHRSNNRRRYESDNGIIRYELFVFSNLLSPVQHLPRHGEGVTDCGNDLDTDVVQQYFDTGNLYLDGGCGAWVALCHTRHCMAYVARMMTFSTGVLWVAAFVVLLTVMSLSITIVQIATLVRAPQETRATHLRIVGGWGVMTLVCGGFAFSILFLAISVSVPRPPLWLPVSLHVLSCLTYTY